MWLCKGRRPNHPVVPKIPLISCVVTEACERRTRRPLAPVWQSAGLNTTIVRQA